MNANNNRLPIEDEVDVISVGTSFTRFLEIAELLNKPVAVVTDSDGDIEAIEKKYAKYLGNNAKPQIQICFDDTVDSGELVIGKAKHRFNYNTLEPKLLKVNKLKKLNTIFETDYKSDDEMHRYMKNHKTECALKIFKTDEDIIFPEYILQAIR